MAPKLIGQQPGFIPSATFAQNQMLAVAVDNEHKKSSAKAKLLIR
jgi:hypothetical protein